MWSFGIKNIKNTGLELLAQLGRLAVMVEAETKKHIVDVEEVHKLREHYRQVHSSIWGFHFLSIQTTGKCNPAVEIEPHKNNTETILHYCFFF